MKYIRRSVSGIEKDSSFIETSFKKYIDDLCIKNMSNLDGRIVAARKKLNRKGIVPCYVNDEILLIPTKSLRDYDCTMINYYKVLSIIEKDGKTIVLFDDLTELNIEISHQKMVKMYDLCEELLLK